MKFGRIYTMIVEGRTEDADGNHTFHQISFPLTCKFHIVKQVTFSISSANFKIFNLSADVRSDIYQDPFELASYRQVTFAAGYEGEQLPQILQGNVKWAFSYRQGPDWITEIEVYDGGSDVENILANITKPAGYSIKDLALEVIKTFGHVTPYALGILDSNITPSIRGITLVGNAWDLITRSIKPYGGFAFINNERVSIINQWEYIVNQGGIDTISADTGMIGTPRWQSYQVIVRMVFEPRIEPAQQVSLITEESRMSGDYSVLRLIHSGTISGAICEEMVTEATLFQPNRNTVAVAPIVMNGILT